MVYWLKGNWQKGTRCLFVSHFYFSVKKATTHWQKGNHQNIIYNTLVVSCENTRKNVTFVCIYRRFRQCLNMIWRKLAVLSLNSANLKGSGFSAKNMAEYLEKLACVFGVWEFFLANMHTQNSMAWHDELLWDMLHPVGWPKWQIHHYIDQL